MRPDAVPPVLDAASQGAAPLPPYPDLVRARVAAGWDPVRAASEPYTPKARLSAEDVQRVRTSEATTAEVAAALRVTPRHVRAIRSRRAWKGV